jgi:hypothetical protein
MKRVTVENLGAFEYDFPVSWEDFSLDELIHVHELMFAYEANQVKGIELLLFCLGFKDKKSFKSEEVKNIIDLPGEWLHTLLKGEAFLGWMFKANGITHYPLKKFKHKYFTYFGPDRSCLDLVSIELIAAYTRFYYFSKTQKQDHLDSLVALLYRPARTLHFAEKYLPSFKPDIRTKLNSYHWKKRAKRLEKLPIGVKMLIVRQFSSEWKKFQEKYKHVFSGKGIGKYDPDNWIKLLINLSGGAFGTVEQIKMHNADEVFKKIEMDLQIQAKIKDKTKS